MFILQKMNFFSFRRSETDRSLYHELWLSSTNRRQWCHSPWFWRQWTWELGLFSSAVTEDGREVMCGSASLSSVRPCDEYNETITSNTLPNHPFAIWRFVWRDLMVTCQRQLVRSWEVCVCHSQIPFWMTISWRSTWSRAGWLCSSYYQCECSTFPYNPYRASFTWFGSYDGHFNELRFV